jgi:hypothetical protein
MPRVIQVVIDPNHTEHLLERLHASKEPLGIRLQKGASVQPPGDVVSIDATTKSLHPLLRLLIDYGRRERTKLTMSTSEVASLVPETRYEEVVLDASEASWEEMELTIGKESNMDVNALAMMFLAGVIAVAGLVNNALHVVIASMIIAPGFEPLVRIGLGAVNGSEAWWRGAKHTLLGFGALFVGSVISAGLLLWAGEPLLAGEPSYLPAGTLVSYWTKISIFSVLVTGSAALVGAILVAANRSVLTAGVMVGLALVPSVAITAMALVSGDFGIATRAVLRWLMEVAFVIIASIIVFSWKRLQVHGRRMIA